VYKKKTDKGGINSLWILLSYKRYLKWHPWSWTHISMWKRNLQVFKDSWSVLYFTIHQILHEDLCQRKSCTKFTPHRLMDEQKQHRLAPCEGFIHTRQDNHNFLYCIFLFPKMTAALKGKKTLKILREMWWPNWTLFLWRPLRFSETF
jgi:hypothetical protein